MQLTKIVVRGFRSLKSVEINVEKYTSLIGRNDAGKSSLLRAIHLLLDAGSTVSPDDVSKFNEEGDACYIEGTFIDMPEDCSVATAGTLTLRRSFGPQGSRWEYVGPTPKNATLKAMLAGNMTKSVYDAAHLPAPVRTAIGALPGGTLRSGQWIEAYRRAESAGVVEKEPGLCPIQASEIETYVQVIFLPADVRAEDETTGSAKSVFGKIGAFLLKGVTSADAELNQAVATIRTRIEELAAKKDDGTWHLETINQMKHVLDEEVHRFDPDVDIVPMPQPPALAPIEFGMRLDVEDAHVKGLGRMGHGLRRSVVFAMLRTLTRMREMGHDPVEGEDRRSPGPIFLFLVEEPEIFLHPQAERKRMKDLETLSGEVTAQVIVCTHSAFFVDMLQYRGIVRVERPNRGETSVRQWSGPDLDGDIAKHLKALKRFEPTNSAMLFADLAILVEGQTEKVCLPELAERLGIPEPYDVEVVDCGGAEGVVAYQDLAEGFGLKYVAWIDADRPVEIAAATARRSAHLGRLVVASPDWEGIAELTGIPDKQKVSASWKKFVLDAGPIPDELSRRVYAAYNHMDCP